MNRRQTIFFILFLSSVYSHAQTGWIQVTGFGSNPGNLNMYGYIPDSVNVNAPLVLVLHGCTQNALSSATESGWDDLADRHKFYLVYAEQQYLNNSSYCFNWYQASDNSRDQGEVYSIRQMVDYMKSNYSIDSTKIFISGLSAGACMAVAALAAYPDVFSAGAINAGCPYGSATDAVSAMNAMNGLVTKTPQQWGDLVRNAYPSFSGTCPKMAIFQGTMDNVVNPLNATELIKQWTNVHNTDQTADTDSTSFNGNTLIEQKVFDNSSGDAVVEYFSISTMMHAIAIDTGNCFQRGGSIGYYSVDKDFYSCFWAAEFFGILHFPYAISGPMAVTVNQQNVVFSVPCNAGSYYQWNFPNDVNIVSGQGTCQVTVDWGSSVGFIEVIETSTDGCKTGPEKLFVDLSTGNNEVNFENEISVRPNPSSGSFIVSIQDNSGSSEINLFDAAGNLYKTISSGGREIMVGGIAVGFYTLEVCLKNKIIRKKIIVIK